MFVNRHLLSFAKGSGGLIMLSAALELLTVIAGSCTSLMSAFAVSLILGSPKAFVFTRAYQPLLCVAALLAFRFILARPKSRTANLCSARIRTRLREDLLERLFAAGPAYVSQSRTGDIANTLSGKVERLSSYYVLYLPTGAAALVNAATTLCALAALDWASALVCLAGCIGTFSCPMLFYPIMKSRGDRELAAHTRYYADCLDSIQGMVTLKALNANSARREFLHGRGEELRKGIMSHLRITALENGILETLARLGGAFSVAVAAIRCSCGAIPSESLIYILFLATACFAPMASLCNAWHLGYGGIGSSESIAELLSLKGTFGSPFESPAENEVKAGECPNSISPNRNALAFRNVSFAYSANEGDVLRNVSFDIPTGTTTALVGPSGSGKSTIAHLMSAFCFAHSGSVSVGGIQACPGNADDIRGMICAVWQDAHIFFGTVHDNIAMGRPDATREEIVEASKKASLHDFIESLPQGYDTQLGENGMRFSGGERQRVALARAFLKDAPILLLDEATSSLDRKNEISVQQGMARLTRGKSALVIAHRMATIESADQICVVDGGRIVAMGTHSELSRSSPDYLSLLKPQEGNILAPGEREAETVELAIKELELGLEPEENKKGKEKEKE